MEFLHLLFNYQKELKPLRKLTEINLKNYNVIFAIRFNKRLIQKRTPDSNNKFEQIRCLYSAFGRLFGVQRLVVGFENGL